jgi:hypothetical protein
MISKMKEDMYKKLDEFKEDTNKQLERTQRIYN